MNTQEKRDSLLAATFNDAILRELNEAIGKIRHCVEQLTEEQLWWRPDESMNSIANLILHLCGNVRQWIVAGVGESPDRRNRPQEFAQRDRLPASQLIEMLDQVAKEVSHTLHNVTADKLIRRRTIQSFDVSGVEAVVGSIAHFRGHTQEITHITRIQLGDAYQFAFIPSPDQQGGAAS